MKQIVRSFSVGLFAAGIIMLIMFYFSDTSNSAEDLELEELVPLVEEKGHRVVSEEEYIALSVQSEDNGESTEESQQDANNNTNDSETETEDNEAADEDERSEDEGSENEESAEEENNEPVEYTLEINSGMASSEIGSVLAENDIIDNASDFTSYLEEHDYTLEVKAGEHEVSSDMSFYELAEEIVTN